jgi:(1->4)-alpha-D-glucan 1-alpha-D-glucosylmutase
MTRLCAEHPNIAQRIDQVIEETNGNVYELDSLLSRQPYRLSRWAESDLVYRRFFDINSMVGIRTENEYVFADTHRLILQWVRAGEVDGLRVDHPDGLQDLRQYLQRFSAAAPRTWIVAEKILALGEHLPCNWNIAGTTGRRFSQPGGRTIRGSARRGRL